MEMGIAFWSTSLLADILVLFKGAIALTVQEMCFPKSV